MPLLTIESQPRLNPPISCWREDMPENHEPQLVPPQLRWLTTRNDTYLEVPRYGTEVIWWGMLGSAILTFGLMVFMLTISILIQNIYLIIVTLVVFFSLLLFCLKMYFVTPRNQPLRLNR
ncbi:MAG: hypothetical protein E7J89_20515, partial [Enterobacter asburiae]|nr:hypothetical protein [Enterobacter asburiae]